MNLPCLSLQTSLGGIVGEKLSYIVNKLREGMAFRG
jgi:hypothetical protein